MKDPYNWSTKHGLGFSIPEYSQGGEHFKEAPEVVSVCYNTDYLSLIVPKDNWC